jgi:hypothetical protein
MPKVLARGRACQGCQGGEALLRGRLDLAAGRSGYASAASPTGMRITMANPFEDPDASYRVLVNDEGQ